MERSELLRLMVLNSICDCLENVDQCILPTVATDCTKLGLSIERRDIVDALTSLVGDGLAKAYIMPDVEVGLEGMPPLDIPEDYFETYFFITKKGMEYHLADDSWWPFDDDGNPLVRQKSTD